MSVSSIMITSVIWFANWTFLDNFFSGEPIPSLAFCSLSVSLFLSMPSFGLVAGEHARLPFFLWLLPFLLLGSASTAIGGVTRSCNGGKGRAGRRRIVLYHGIEGRKVSGENVLSDGVP